MQAVLLAAGESSRFYPLNTRHKCLVKIAGEPLIVHTIRAVKRSGITDIILVVGENNEFKEFLGNGKKYGVKIQYVVQKKPEGMGDALLLSSHLIHSDFFLVNSNHVEFEVLKKAIDSKRTNREAILSAVENKTEKHFGVLKVDRDKVLSIVEKPKNAKGLSSLRVVGVYFLNLEFLELLKKTKKEHYSLETALDSYAKKGKVRVATVESEIASLKYPWDVLSVKTFVLSRQKRNISKKATVAKNAIVEGDVVIEEGAKVSENAVIKGPAYIGRDVVIGTNVLVRDGSDIEQGAKIGAFMEIKNSLIGEESTTHSGFIGDSVVGEKTKIAALFGTANVRLDRTNVKSVVKGEVVDTGRRSLGVIIGGSTVIGERVSTMPGTIIGNNVVIGPSTTVMKNVESDTVYYTKFAEIVKKNKK